MVIMSNRFFHQIGAISGNYKMFILSMKNNLRKIRETQGLKLREVAEKANTTPQQIQRLEKGERKLSPEWLSILSKALGCSPTDILPGLSNNSDEWIQEQTRWLKGLNKEGRQAYEDLKALHDKHFKKD